MAKTDTISSERNYLAYLKDKKNSIKAIKITVISGLILAFLIYIVPKSIATMSSLISLPAKVALLDSSLNKKASVEYVNKQDNSIVAEKERVHMTMWSTFTGFNETNKAEHKIMLDVLKKQCKNDAERNKLLEDLLNLKKESSMKYDSISNYNNKRCTFNDSLSVYCENNHPLQYFLFINSLIK